MDCRRRRGRRVINPQVLLALAHHIIGAPSREHAAHIFAQMCLQDMAAAAHLAEFLAYVLPDSTDLWGGVLHGISEHLTEQSKQAATPPFTWADADSADTAASIDTHLRGADHAPES